MKKSELKNLIKECYRELNEGKNNWENMKQWWKTDISPEEKKYLAKKLKLSTINYKDMKPGDWSTLMNKYYKKNYVNESINIVQEAEVDTWRFEAAHGKKPRGNGGWYFTKTNKDIDFHTDREGVDYVMVRGQFTKAWKEAARRLNAAMVWAQS